MFHKQYSALVYTPPAKFTRAADARFRTEIFYDKSLARSNAALPNFGAYNEGITMVETGFYMDSLFNEDSTDIFENDKSVQSIRATRNCDKIVRPSLWETQNAERISQIENNALQNLTTELLSTTYKSILTVSSNLFRADKTRHPKDSVTVSKWVRVYVRFFTKT